MAISIDSYRSRIGLIENRIIRIRSRKNVASKNSSIFYPRPSLVLLAIFIANSSGMLGSCKADTLHPPQDSPQQQAQVYPCNQLFYSTLIKYNSPTKPQAPVNHNSLSRYKYGNRGKKKNGITIMHWNKGSSILANKLDDIETIVEEYTPHLLGLSEANLRKGDDLQEVQLENYTLHTCPTIDNPNHGVSRVVAYTHKSLRAHTRQDLMNPQVSAVWLEVGLPGKQKFLVCNAYREWGYPNQPDKQSHSVPAQKTWWSLFLDGWEAAIKEDKEIIVLGDMNICHIKWMQQDLPKSDSNYKLRHLTQELFDRIIPHGFCQLVQGASHIRQGQERSGLDHLYSNKLNKLSDISLLTNSASDHKMIHVVRYSKAKTRNIRYVKKRMFKDFNQEGFRADIKLIGWWSIYGCNDANTAAETLTKELNKALDRWALVKNIQVRPKYRPWITKETKVLMRQ